MKKLFFSFICLGANIVSFSQNIKGQLTQAYQRFESDSQLQSALSSLYVINAGTGEVVFDKNSRIGLATASTLKIVTAATAYELLGKDFRYATQFGFAGKVKNRELQGNLLVRPSGDPTLGSWRWKGTTDTVIIEKLVSEVRQLNINTYNSIAVDANGWNEEAIPDGWTWQDIGNYYGAGASGLNWRENQYDILLKSGKKIGDPVSVTRTNPVYVQKAFISLATSAAKGSGDNAYIYYPLGDTNVVIRGTIPVNENAFTISAANPKVTTDFTSLLANSLHKRLNIHPVYRPTSAVDTTIFFTHYSPSLDSIVYWFLKKSINLYGESLLKTLAYQKKGLGATEEGVHITREFWRDKGIDPVELNIVDGSGLSPLNRVTTHAQVQVLQYARIQSWFQAYFDAFPVYNDMKMKSGTIHAVKGFCGYHTSKDGNVYIFSFLVNNYNGSSGTLVRKMYQVLNELK